MSIDPADLSGVQRGPLRAGERVTLADVKGHRHTLLLEAGRIFHTTKGALAHDDIIGRPQGIIVSTAGGLEFTVFRPLLHEYTVSMPREAAVVYPKDAAQIVLRTDIFPGARVLESGVGSGALSLYLLRAIGPTGSLHSYERRAEFAQVAQDNVEEFLGRPHPGWTVSIGDLAETIADEPVDRAILDMLRPWDCVDAVAGRLVPGGLLCCYVTTTTQMGRVADQLRHHGGLTEPAITETTVREWHAEGLAIRPGHGTSAHTGFLVISRRMAPGVAAPVKKRRPAPGAYGPDYHGPVPRNVAAEHLEANRRRATDEAGQIAPAVRTALRRRAR
ncbi:tRNA (adenine-N1)-methyltransferase [uncultured Propionibacterium sp.]|uniref:tRNA (adenine-N1)-methyltransferase n=1 Tax=uncultured Propionibacterium sp. TaxID=218066 RepID=UPI0037DCFC19